MNERRLLNEAETAKYLACSRQWLRKLRMRSVIREGRACGPAFIRAGRMIRYDKADLDHWIDERKHAPRAI